MNRLTCVTIILLYNISLHAQSAHKSLRNGDMLYGYNKFSQAETEYRKAEEAKPSVKSSYNLGNTLMQQERYEEAAKKYEEAAQKATTDVEKSDIYYNQGNALYNKKEYQQSIEAYKKSLRFSPENEFTKENLAIARQALKKQQQQQNQQQQQQKDQQQQQDQPQQNKNEQQQQDQQQNQDQSKKENQQNQGENQNQDKNPKLSESEARKLLDIIDNEEKKVQQKLRRSDGRNKKIKKDW